MLQHRESARGYCMIISVGSVAERGRCLTSEMLDVASCCCQNSIKLHHGGRCAILQNVLLG